MSAIIYSLKPLSPDQRDAINDLNYANKKMRQGIKIYEKMIKMNEALIEEVRKNG